MHITKLMSHPVKVLILASFTEREGNVIANRAGGGETIYWLDLLNFGGV